MYDTIRITKEYDDFVTLVKNDRIKPNEKDGIGRSPLIFAVDIEVPIKICKQLVKAGCDPHCKDNNGDSLLHYAVNLDNEQLENWLLNDIGISRDVKNKQG